MFKSLRKEPVLITTVTEPPTPLRTDSYDQLAALLLQFEKCFTASKEAADDSRSLGKEIKNLSFAEDESEEDVEKHLDGLISVDVAERVLGALRAITTQESIESSNFERLLTETVHQPSKKFREVIPCINRLINQREDMLLEHAKMDGKLVRYEREKFTNPKSWKIPQLQKEKTKLVADFKSLEKNLVEELKELLKEKDEYFCLVVQAFANAELSYVGEQANVIREVSAPVKDDCDSVRNSDFHLFFEGKKNELLKLGIVSGTVAAARIE